MNDLFPILYVILLILSILFAICSFIFRNNKNLKDFFTHASIGMVARQTFFWFGSKTLPRDDDEE